MAMSRRFFMGSGVLGTATLATGLSVTSVASAAESCPGASSDREDAFIAATAESFSRVMEENPEAPGLQALEQLINDTYPAEPGSEDDLLLQGALYLEAQRLFEMRAAPLSDEELSEGLSASLNVDKVNPEYFQTLLARTKERVACDAAYAETVATASAKAREIPCEGRRWLCGLILVAIVLCFILL